LFYIGIITCDTGKDEAHCGPYYRSGYGSRSRAI